MEHLLLNEKIRVYVRARYINESRGPGGKIIKHTQESEMPEFGEVSQKELKKRARKKKKRSRTHDEKLLVSVKSGGLKFADEELACLRAGALQAIKQAREQLGAGTHYCKAMIRTKEDCDGSCKENPVYMEVNDGKSTQVE